MRQGANIRAAGLRAVAWACLLSALASCAGGGPQSTRLQASDFNYTVNRMAESLRSSDFLADRGPDSEPAYITIRQVENLTSDIIPERERWMLMERVQAALNKRELAERNNIRFQIPPEHRQDLDDDPRAAEAARQQMPETTHVMKAVFMSSKRAQRNKEHRHVERRQDYYYLEYSITALESRNVVWTETFEFKREAAGLAID